jgi:hypothetical protein
MEKGKPSIPPFRCTSRAIREMNRAALAFAESLYDFR